MSDETPPEIPQGMMKPAHGKGLLKRGGSNPGSGRPASAIRRRLRGDFAQRMGVLRGIADGTVEVSLREACEHCGLPPSKPQLREWMESMLKKVRSAVGDQLKAMDLMAKYGIGTLKTVTDDDVHGRLLAQFDIIRRSPNVHAGKAEALIDEIEAAWLRKPTTR